MHLSIFTHYFLLLMMMTVRLTLMMLLFSFGVRAQVGVHVFAGPHITSAHYVVRDSKQDAEFRFGGMAGMSLKVPFDNQLYFFPTVNYSLKGYRVTLKEPSFPPTELAVNNETTIHTVDISPLLQIDLSKNPSHFFVRFGPSVDLVFSGKEKFDTLSTSGAPGTVERPMIFSFGDYGRISASAIIHLGYQFQNGAIISGFYQHGIGSMNNADNGPRILHRIAGLSIGWMFWKKR